MDGIIGHEGNGPSAGEPRDLGLLGASGNVFALDVAIAEILGVKSDLVPTLVAQQKLGLPTDVEEIDFSLLHPRDLAVSDWKLPEALMPIDFGLPRVFRSTFKHLYIRFIKEPLSTYSHKK